MKEYKYHCACHKCGAKADVDMGMLYPTDPVKLAYDCPACGEHGWCFPKEVRAEATEEETKRTEPPRGYCACNRCGGRIGIRMGPAEACVCRCPHCGEYVLVFEDEVKWAEDFE